MDRRITSACLRLVIRPTVELTKPKAALKVSTLRKLSLAWLGLKVEEAKSVETMKVIFMLRKNLKYQDKYRIQVQKGLEIHRGEIVSEIMIHL
jgi:hypothetical protein